MAEASQALLEEAQGLIERFSWVSFAIQGQEHSKTSTGKVGVGKDVRVLRSEVSAWKELKGHLLKKSMVTSVYGEGVDVLVIGDGVYGALEVSEKVKRDVAEYGIPKLVIEHTPEACGTSNRLFREGKKVALLAHGTC